MNFNIYYILTDGKSEYRFKSLGAAAKRALDCHRYGWTLKSSDGIKFPEREWPDLVYFCSDEPEDTGKKVKTIDEVFFTLKKVSKEEYTAALKKRWGDSYFTWHISELSPCYGEYHFFIVGYEGREYPMFKCQGCWHFYPEQGSSSIRRMLLTL